MRKDGLAGIVGCMILACIITMSSSTPSAADDQLPPNFFKHPFNGRNNPTVHGDVIRFRLHDRQCSNVIYGNGSNESDCKNGNVRSAITHGRLARMGEVVRYSFEFRLDKNFSDDGVKIFQATDYLKSGWDSKLRIASWEGEYRHNFIYTLKANEQRGVTFLGKVCQDPSSFGKWSRFEMDIKWSNDTDGWIVVRCDGREVHRSANIRTTLAPHCWHFNGCDPNGRDRKPTNILFILGPVYKGRGHDYAKNGYSTPFFSMQQDGIRVDIRRPSVTLE